MSLPNLPELLLNVDPRSYGMKNKSAASGLVVISTSSLLSFKNDKILSKVNTWRCESNGKVDNDCNRRSKSTLL